MIVMHIPANNSPVISNKFIKDEDRTLSVHWSPSALRKLPFSSNRLWGSAKCSAIISPIYKFNIRLLISMEMRVSHRIMTIRCPFISYDDASSDWNATRYNVFKNILSVSVTTWETTELVPCTLPSSIVWSKGALSTSTYILYQF